MKATASSGQRERLVIVGNGMVGHHCVEQLLAGGALAHYRIEVFGEEAQRAYDRVHLSEYFGGRDAESLAMSAASLYEEEGPTLHLGCPVLGIDREAREVLPREIPMAHAVTQWGNVGGLVAGLALGDVALIGRSMHDVVAEPYRKGFIPGYDRLKEEVLSEGALAMNIAGSGPSVFALASNYEAAVRISGEMKRHFEGLGIGCNSYAGRVSNRGARIEE